MMGNAGLRLLKRSMNGTDSAGAALCISTRPASTCASRNISLSNLKIDRGEMLVVALRALRFGAEKVDARLRDYHALSRADSRLRLQIEGEGAFDDHIVCQRGHRFLAELAFLRHKIVNT